MALTVVRSRRRLLLTSILVICISYMAISALILREKSMEPTRVVGISIYPTINSAGIVVTYQRDSNRNNWATVKFRVKGEDVWRDGHPFRR